MSASKKLMSSTSLKVRLSLIVILVMTLFACTLVGVSAYLSYRFLYNSYHNQIENIGKNIDKQIDEFYKNQMFIINFFSKSAVIRNAVIVDNYEEVIRFFSIAQQDMSIYENIFIATSSDDPVINASPIKNSIGIKFKLPENTQNIEEVLKGKTHISMPHKSPVTGLAAVLISSPILINNQLKAGLYFAIHYSKFIQPIIRNIKIGEKGYSFIFNDNQIIVAHPDDTKVLKENISNFPLLKKILESKKENDTLSGTLDDKTVLINYNRNVEHGYTIVTLFYVEEIIAKTITLSSTLFIILIIGVGITAVLIYYSIRERLIPLQEAIRVANAVSKGDLSKLDIGVNTSSDEFGELSAAMRELILKIRKVLFEIQKAADNLENSAQSLAENTIHFKEIVKDQKQSTDNVYEFLLELNAGITEISAESKTQFRLLSELNEKVSNLYSKIKDIEKLSQNASSSVKETQKQIEKSSSSVREMEDSIRKIGASSGEMRKIIKIIEDISNKTNLLALNAAIEAARAGDQGLGFTVVAGEVAKLSEETRRSVSNISQKLKENEEEIKTGISKVNVTVEIFNQIISSVKKIGDSVNNIYQNVQTQTELNRLIENEIGKVKDKAANIQEKTSLQSRKTREAFDSIEKLKKSAEENLNGIENISSESKSLEKTSKLLGDEVEFFKL